MSVGEEELPTADHPSANNNAASMRSIETDLNHVEQHLSGSHGSQGGAPVFQSIRSFLGSIRTRLEGMEESCHSGRNDSHSDETTTGEWATQSINNMPMTSRNESSENPEICREAIAVSNNQAIQNQGGSSCPLNFSGVMQGFMSRLRSAELAHSTRIPLHMLRDRRHQSSTQQSSASNQLPDSKDEAGNDGGACGSSSASQSVSRTPRRSSTSLASRRMASEAEGFQVDMNLHGTMAHSLSTSIHGSTVKMSESMEIDEEDMEIDEEDGDERDNSAPPLLTQRTHASIGEEQRSVLFPLKAHTAPSSDMDGTCQPSVSSAKPASIIYSWGSGTNSLHSDRSDVSLESARVNADGRVGRHELVSCSVGSHHIGCVTATGGVLVAGENSSGEVDPGRRDDALIANPIPMESIFPATVLQVSCGFNHTAVLRSTGTILTWGSNEFGQLGHRTGANPSAATKFVQPAVMSLLPGQHATSVACGDGFTMCLTSRMSVMVCGIKDITGFAPEEARRLPLMVPALEDLPIVSIAAGRRHAVVITSHGSAFAWGDNYAGACGRDFPLNFTNPVHFKTPPSLQGNAELLSEPLTNWMVKGDGKRRSVVLSDDVAVAQATCGMDHTVLVTRSGRAFVCGMNSTGQLGFDPKLFDFIRQPKIIEHENRARSFTRAAAGEFHTLLLDDIGDVWQMGGATNKAGAIERLFTGKRIRVIAAGGGHSVALTTGLTRLPRKRELSESIATADGKLAIRCSLEEVIRTIPEQPSANCDVVNSIARNAESLFRSPAVLNSLFMDPTELDELFSKLLSDVEFPDFQRLLSRGIERGMYKGLDNLRSRDMRLTFPEQVRFLLLYLQCPFFVEWKHDDFIFDRRGDTILALCETILSLNYEGYKALMCWATSIYSRETFVRFLVKPLLSQLEKALSVEAGAERRPIPSIVSVLRLLRNASEQADNLARPEDFYSDAVGALSPQILLTDLQQYKKANKQKQAAEFFFCSNPFLFSPSAKRNLLRIENELNMFRTAAQDARFNPEEGTFELAPFYVLEIERSHLMEQTMEKLSKADSKDLRKKLRIVFKDEEGIDAGGVTREYFQILCAQLFDMTSGMWNANYADISITWFNAECFWNDEGFFLCGILVGLAVYNGVLLDTHFPPAIYRKLLGEPLGFEDLFDEQVKSGLQQLLDYEGDDVEDIFCLSFDVAWMDLGEEKRKELKPNGSNIPVTSGNKEEYVMLYVRWLLVDSVYPQYNSFEAGFSRVMEDSTLDMLRPEELELLVVGSPELDFSKLEENTEYEGGFTAESPVIRNFWQFVHHAPLETQLNLLKFSTGSAKAPIGGLGKLNFKIQRAGPDSEQLPSSHTCFNTLLLPDYGDNKEKLEQQLGRSLLECEGFGLQ